MELELFDFIVMPNHFHALLRIHFAPSNREHHLGFLMSRFKGGTSFIYGRMRRMGKVEDVGDWLWQRDYWDDLVVDEAEFRGWQKYIRENPANWSSDRYGACTAYTCGDTDLLNHPRIAFVASQGFYASELRPRKIWPWAAKAAPSEKVPAIAAPSEKVPAAAPEKVSTIAAPSEKRPAAPSEKVPAAAEMTRGSGGASEKFSEGAASAAPVLISTFTSAQEREALRRALEKKRPLIVVFPAGIPAEVEMASGLANAIREGRALAISPQPPNSRLNKKIATWSNEFILKNAGEIWVGDLSPNGMLTQMLSGLGKLKSAGELR